jgi:MSHA biogenesis protein MshQ
MRLTMIKTILRTMIKMRSPSLKIVAGSLLLLTSTGGMAASCLDVFPTVLSSSASKGKVEFERDVNVNGTNGSLDIEIKKDETSDSNPSCITQKCTDSNNRSEAFSLPSFQTSSSSDDYTVDNGDSLNLPQGSYDKITVNYEATVRFTQNSDVTFIDELKADNTDTTVIFEEGVYWIKKFKVGYRTKVIINGDDKVTLIVKDKTEFDQTEVSFNEGGKPNQLVLIAYSDIKLGYNSDFKGFIYADKKVELKNENVFEGAINGDDIKLRYQAAITFAPDSIESANFNGFCSVSNTPLTARVNYRFDECTLNGEADDVIDQAGNYNGGSNGVTPNTDSAIINKALDLSANNTSDWIDVPSSAVDGLDDFSVAVWFKTSVNKSQQQIFHALGKDTKDDELEIFLNNSHGVYIKVRDSSEVLTSTIELTDGNWHHLVLTRVDKNVCLFIDGTGQKCGDGVNDGVLSITNANAIVIGQEQDSFGGSFTTEQSFVGQLDEFKIFDVKLSDTEIDNIYQNESDGNNFDGTTRDAMQCEYICGLIPGELNAVGIRIDSSGSDNQIDTISESLNIHAAWLNAGSPASGFIANSTYNVTESGASTVDRLDFGGDENAFAGTLPYPGIGTIGDESFSNFLVHTSGTLSLPAGDYTIYVESDDGFSFVMDTLDGDTVTFNKFGSSTAGASNELRYENTTGNSRTGGSFTLTQDSIFELTAVFFERNGSDFLEVSIANELLDSSSTNDYEILREGAINDKVKLGLCVIQPPLLEYRFEGIGWDGSPDEIFDHTGNGHNGQVNSNSIPETASPALTGDYGSCGYASQNGGSIQVTGLPLDTSTIDVKTTVTFWMNWDGTDNTMPIGWNTHDIWIRDGSIGFNTGNGDLYGISSAGLANGWHHVTVEFTNGSVTDNRMHIDGIEQVLSQKLKSPNNSQAFVKSELRIGGWSKSSGYNFHGLIDEVRVYQGVLTTTEVKTIMNKRHDCIPAAPDHFEIQHNGNGFTCEAKELTIKACADANCDNLYTQETSITLSPSGWADNDTIVFKGEIKTSLSVTDEGTVSLAKVNASPDADLRCYIGGAANCDLTFSNDGFEIYGANFGDSLPDQLAANDFQNVNIRAVRSNENVCEALLEGTQKISLSYDCISPDQCLTPLNDITITNDVGENTGNINVEFNDQGVASLALLNYPDAGRLSLSVQAVVDGVTIDNSGIETVDVYPSYLKLAVDQSELLYGSSGAQNNYIAGEPFTVSIGAYGVNDALLKNYQAENPEIKVTRLLPVSTSAQEGTLAYSNTGVISSSTSANFTQATSLRSDPVKAEIFDGGEYIYSNTYYDEVGRIEIDIKDSAYLGNEISSNSSLRLGDFYPAFFKVIDSNVPILANTSGVFSYIGETITFATNPELTITAYNARNEITANYSDIFWNYLPDELLLKANLSYADSSTYISTGTISEIDVGDAPIVTNNANYDGSGTVIINNGEFQYNKVDLDNSTFDLVSPFDGSINLVFSSDFFNATFIGQASSKTICFKEEYASTSCNSLTIEAVKGTELRYGRLNLPSTYGPETESLTVMIQAEYYDNSQWRLNTDDNSTSIAFDQSANHIRLIESGDSDITGNIGNISSTGMLLLGVASDTNDFLIINNSQTVGALKLQLDPSNDPTTWSTYLNYDWNGDGIICNHAIDCPDDGDNTDDDYDPDMDFPEATITFGQFRGIDRIIQWREVSN